MPQQIRRFGVGQTAKVVGVLYGLIGVFLLPIFLVISAFAPREQGFSSGFAIALPLLRGRAPAWPASAWVPALARRCLAVTDPDGEPGVADRLAFGAMAARAQWLRMPPWLVVYHAAHKLVRARPRPAEDPAV